MLYSFCVLLLSAAPIVSLTPPPPSLRSSSAPDFDVLDFKSSTESRLTWYPISGQYKSTGRDYVGHIATFEPSYFSFEPPTSQGCNIYVKTSKSSKGKCEYATNGGFFSFDKTLRCKCVGNLVSHGESFILEGMSNANYGITPDNQIVSGFIDNDTFTQMNFTHLMSGSGWLVRHGVSYVDSSGDLDLTSNFVLEKAPRTSVGHFSNGTMILFEVDGEEDINYGPDLYEMAELLVELGVDSAVNIDGGGSSVSVYDGEVISEPTCDDTSTICERRVQSFTCVRK